jgi:hypothetical protein
MYKSLGQTINLYKTLHGNTEKKDRLHERPSQMWEDNIEANRVVCFSRVVTIRSLLFFSIDGVVFVIQ